MKPHNASRRSVLKKMTLLGLSLPVVSISEAAKTLSFETKRIGRELWDELKNLVSGLVVPKDQVEYQIVRKSMVWNKLLPKNEPEAIVTVRKQDELQRVVKFAHANDLKVSIRGRGHHADVLCLQDQSVLVDISGLNTIKIDSAKSTAVVGAGAMGADLSKEAERYNLAFPVGHCPTVPMSGFLLGGGYGWNSRAWGIACSNIMAVDVVTAEGELIHANEKQNQDYLWAAKGGGAAFFGIVTRYHLNLFPNPTSIMSSIVIYPLEMKNEVAIWVDSLVESLVPEVEFGCLLVADPNAPERKSILVSATAFAYSAEEAMRWLKPLDAGPSGYLKKELYTKRKFSELQDGSSTSEKLRYQQDTFLVNENPSEFLPGLLEVAKTYTAPQTVLMVAFRPTPEEQSSADDMAFSVFGNTYVAAYGAWHDASDDEKNKAWVKTVSDYVTPFSVGNYVNESKIRGKSDRPEKCFSKENWQKLQRLRQQYDPEELFTYFPKA